MSLVEGEVGCAEEVAGREVEEVEVELEEVVGRSLEAFATLRRERPASRADSSPRQVRTPH